MIDPSLWPFLLVAVYPTPTASVINTDSSTALLGLAMMVVGVLLSSSCFLLHRQLPER